MKLVVILLGLLLFLSGCQTAPATRSYLAPGDQNPMRLQVRKNDGVPAYYELQIDGVFVVQMPSHDLQSRAVASHKGKMIEMRGMWVRGSSYVTEVLVDGALAASFDFGTL
jgi:hypothetical protein